MAKALTDFHTELDIRIVDVGPTFLTRALLRACREFCEIVPIYREDLAAISIVASDATYTLSPTSSAPSTCEIVKVLRAEVSDCQLQIVTEDFLNTEYVGGNWTETEATTPYACYILPDRSTLRLFPIPTDAVTSGLFVSVQLRPALTATSVPDVLYNQYMTEILDGAKAQIYGQVEQAWANIQWSEFYRNKFSKGIFTAKARLDQGYGNGVSQPGNFL